MLRHRFLFLILLFFLNVPLQAQRYVDGWIINSAGDTVRGKVYFRVRHESLVRVSFIHDNQKEESFGPSDIRGAGLGTEYYLSKVVTADKSPWEQDLSADTTFLEILVAGRMSLLRYRDEYQKAHYYILKEDGTTTELAEHIIEGSGPNGQTRKVTPYYIGTFKVTFPSCADLHAETDKSVYTEASLVSLFRKYYQCTYGKGPDVKPKKRIQTVWGLTAGASLVDQQIEEYHPFSSSVLYKDLAFTFPTPLVATGGVVLELHGPGPYERFAFRNELMYRAVSSTSDSLRMDDLTTSTTTVATFSYSHLRYNGLARYYFSYGKFRPYATAGISFSFLLSHSSQRTVISQFLSNPPTVTTFDDFLGTTSSTDVGFIGGAGVAYHPFGLEVRYEYSGGLQPTISPDSKAKTLSFLVSYRFGKK